MKNNRILVINTIASALVFMKIVSGSNIFLVGFVTILFYGMFIEKNDLRINYILFFISWVYVIKFDLNQFSLMILISFIYCILTTLHILKFRKKIPKKLILIFILFIIYSIFSLFQGVEQSIFQISGFLLGYLVLLLASVSTNFNTPYFSYFFHYSLGLLIGSLIRALGYILPSVESYILDMGRINTVYTEGILYVRFAGLDIDPNYYAIQIMLAISLNLVLILSKPGNNISHIIITLGLVIFGLLSFSKMYILTLILFNILLMILLFKSDLKKFLKYISIISAIGLAIFIEYGNYFYHAYFIRFFGAGETLATITTGRSEGWQLYLDYIFSNFNIFLFGNGLGNGFLENKIAHNMYLLSWYQIGIVGGLIYLLLLYFLYKNIKSTFKNYEKVKIAINILPLVIILVPNFTLDSFVMDYFPLQLFLVMIAGSIMVKKIMLEEE